MALLIPLGLLGIASCLVFFHRASRARSLVALLFVLSVAWWWGAEYVKHHRLRIHTWEVFHHYLHAKYLPELRYRRMYQCVAEAAGDDGRDIRDLVDNQYRPVAEIHQRDGRCRSSFTPARWETFAQDVAWFRSEIGPEWWEKVYFDHGANASPTWAAVAKLFVSEGSVTRSVVERAASADTVLLATLWIALWWSFGPVAATLAAVLWSTCVFGGYTWTGGAFLRKDWMLAFVLAIVSLRRGLFLTAGLFAGYAGLVRIFPLAIVGAAAGFHWIVAPSDRKGVVRFGIGAVGAVALGYAAPFLIFDPGVWGDFVANLAKHRATRAGNVVGLPQILENVLLCRYGPYGGPAGSCALPEQRGFEMADVLIMAVRIAAAAAALGVLVWRFRHDSLWLKVVVLLGALPLCVDAASYDLEVLAFLGLAACHVSRTASGVLVTGWAIMNGSALLLRSAPGNTIWTVLGVELVLTLALWFVYAERRFEKSGQEGSFSSQ